MDVRAYLQWRIETHQAAKELARKRLEKVGYVLAMIGMAALWIVGWMLG
jgi:hypothetical protein